MSQLHSRITEAEDRISEIEDRMVEINDSEKKKEKLITTPGGRQWGLGEEIKT